MCWLEVENHNYVEGDHPKDEGCEKEGGSQALRIVETRRAEAERLRASERPRTGEWEERPRESDEESFQDV